MRHAGPMMLAVLAGLTTSAFAATDYPLVLDNCGFEVTIDSAPERVVTIKSTATEMLLALGLGDRIVGIGFQDGPLPPPLAAAGAGLLVLSDKLPGPEVVLETEPDFIYGGWESNFAGDGAGERETLARLGIASYVAPAACRTPPYVPENLGFSDLFEQIAEMGAIFDVGDQAAILIAEQQAMLDALVADDRGLTALWYSSGTKVPYVGGGGGAPDMMLEALGLENIMADAPESWISASWEAIVDADPDVIVLVDAAWNPVAQKKQLLADNPITSQLDAVKNERYLVLPFPAAEAGVRNVPATVDMAAQLRALDFTQ